MPKPASHVLTWSEAEQRYTLSTHGQLQQSFQRDDAQLWQSWLLKLTAFAFHGEHGHASIVKETRAHGKSYWYAYSTFKKHTSKHYLGNSSNVTLARLEQEVRTFTREHASEPQKRPPSTGLIYSVAATNQNHASHAPLLDSRQTPPRLPAALVQRQRLFQELDTVLKHQLLLLSASAGSGKTTLLSAWAAQSGHTIGWLSLDELDNNPTRFWASFIAMLRTCLPKVGETALAMLYTPQPPPLSTVLITLINEILSYTGEIILLLDDYHLIDDQTIHDGMLFLLDHLPANLHLILSSRVDPPLPLSRWRVRGQMTEIRESALRFTQEETNQFLSSGMQLALSQDEMQLLEERTEGWIAGLQLAALSLRTQQDPARFIQHFTGGQRFILDYVQEEILRHLPPPLQNFLLQVSLLSRMNASLCQALTEEAHSQELLETLERGNLFMIPLDEQQQWYRLHALFREVLLARLQLSQPELIPTLHQRAARWYCAHNFFHEAITHAFAANDYAFAGTIVEQAASSLWMRGEARTIATWLLKLPDAIFAIHIDSALTSALHLLSSTQVMPEQQHTQALMQSEQLIARVEQLIAGGKKDIDLLPVAPQRLRNRICLLHAFMLMSTAFRKSDMQRVRTLAQEMQTLAGEEAVAWKWPALYGLFVSAQLLGDAVLLLPELLALKQQALQEQDIATATAVMCWISAALLYAGKLQALQQECLQTQALLSQAGEPVAVAAYPSFDLSFLYYERNQLELAENSLQSAMQHATRWQDMNLLIWSYATYVKVMLAAGKIAAAEEALEYAQDLMQRTGFTVYEPDVAAARVALWLAQGKLPAANAWAEDYIFDPEAHQFFREEEYLALARVYLAQQHYASCLQLLAQLLPRMERFERHWDIIHLLALQVCALSGQGQALQAQQVALRLLSLTEPEGYIRVYLDSGEAMRSVLQSLCDSPDPSRFATHVSCTSYVRTLLLAFEQERQRHIYKEQNLRTNLGEMPTLKPLATSQQAPYEPLSPQEQRVLSLLVAGRTYAEIARELIVSPNTIKTQVSSIYRKLGVSRRAEASVLAQQLHLL